MRITTASLAFAVALFLAGCGARFGPGFSMTDKRYFSDSPHIVLHTNTMSYGLRWQYGTMGFYFDPNGKVVDGQLLFSLQATSSSGVLSGRYAEIPITEPAQIRALVKSGAFWLESDGRKVQLTVKKL